MSEVNPNYNPLSDWKEPNEELMKAAEKYKQRELLKEIMKDDENDGLYDETFNTKEK